MATRSTLTSGEVPLLDFSPLGQLGEVYKKAQKERTLADIGRMIRQGGTLDHAALAGSAASLGDLGTALALLKMKQEQEASAKFGDYLKMFRQGGDDGMPSPAAAPGPTPRPPVSSGVPMGPAPVGMMPPTSEAAARPKVASTARWVGDDEAMASGLYPTAPGVPMPTPAPLPKTNQPVAQGAPSLPSQGEPPILPSRNPLFNRALELMAVASDPRLPKQQGEIAKLLATKALEDAKPDPEERKYSSYYVQERVAGRVPLSFFEFMKELRRSTAPDKGETSFETAFGTKQADRWNSYISNSEAAQKRLVDINSMRDISRLVGQQGLGAQVKELLGPAADFLGIDISNLSDIQTYTSIIERLAPQQRAIGSGSTSDIEYMGFKKSLPRLIANPASREAVLDTMEALARHEMAQGEIASRLATKEITRGQAEKEIRTLPDPMKGFIEWRKANPGLYVEARRAAETTPVPRSAGQGKAQDRPQTSPPVPGARLAPDGKWYVDDPNRPGKFLQVQ